MECSAGRLELGTEGGVLGQRLLEPEIGLGQRRKPLFAVDESSRSLLGVHVSRLSVFGAACL